MRSGPIALFDAIVSWSRVLEPFGGLQALAFVVLSVVNFDESFGAWTVLRPGYMNVKTGRLALIPSESGESPLFRYRLFGARAVWHGSSFRHGAQVWNRCGGPGDEVRGQKPRYHHDASALVITASCGIASRRKADVGGTRGALVQVDGKKYGEGSHGRLESLINKQFMAACRAVYRVQGLTSSEAGDWYMAVTAQLTTILRLAAKFFATLSA
jgi:hypothetical protein